MQTRSVWGPKLWAELHASPLPPRPAVWAIEFLARVPCLACRDNFIALLMRHPPPPDGCTLEQWRRWGWEIHEAEKRARGPVALTPESFSFDQAAARWGWGLTEGMT